MEPGRELDALVAEKVLAYRCERFWPVQDLRSDTSKPCENWYEPGGRIIDHLPFFSRDIWSAWQLVEKLRIAVIPIVPGNRWAASQDEHEALYEDDGKEVFSYFDRSIDLYSIAGTAPHAICLAALQAVGVDA